MNLSILSQLAVDSLRDRLASDIGVHPYGAPTFDLAGLNKLSTAIDVGPVPALLTEVPQGAHAASTDLENAIRIYEWLGPLDEIVAADQRLWITLAHEQFFAYARWRWPLRMTSTSTAPEIASARRHVISHWFFRGSGLSAMRRNAISRLWWAAHLTCAPWERDVELLPFKKPDRFFYTRVLLWNQDVYQGLLEREFAVNPRVLAATLETIGRDPAKRATSSFVTQLLKQVNLLARYRELTVVPAEELVQQLEEQSVAD